jgi:two-component system nitrate/nitrite response regulator NarP
MPHQNEGSERTKLRIPLVAALDWSNRTSRRFERAALMNGAVAESFPPSVAISGGNSTVDRAPQILVADRQPLMIQGMAQALRGCGSEMGEHCVHAHELYDVLMRSRADAAILDVRLGEPHTLKVLSEARRNGLRMLCILTIDALAEPEVLEAIRLGIKGIVRRDASLEAVGQCVRTVLAGENCLDHGLVSRAMSSLLMREAGLRELAQILTVREMQVLQLVVSGLRTREMADRLHVSAGTLKVHLYHIYQKLRISTRDELMKFAEERALI